MFFDWEKSTEIIVDSNRDMFVRDEIIRLDIGEPGEIILPRKGEINVPWKMTHEQLATFAGGIYYIEGRGINWNTVKRDWSNELKTGWEKSGDKYKVGPHIDGIAISQPPIRWNGIVEMDSRISSSRRAVGHGGAGNYK